MKKGIDVSYHQKNINFDLVKKDGVEFVILRAGYRDKADPKFVEYVKDIKTAGIKILGVYFFSYALNVEEVKKEAKLCTEIMENSDLGKDIMVFYDFEYDTVKKAAEKGIALTKKECNKHTEAFCEEIKNLGYIPGVYMNLDYHKNWYNQDVLQKYPIWLADYKGEADHKCLIQQYTNVGKVAGINGNVDMDYYYEEEFKMKEENKRSRSEVVKLAKSWIGKKESDGSFKSIIDIYNSYMPHPRGYKMTYDDSWCATFWSALGIALGYTDIIPIECSCGELIKKAKEMGIWIEDDSYQPSPGDGILYDWDDDGKGDNTGWPDHVGVVEKINEESFTVIEGNKNDAVGRRTVKMNGKFIRGFITPKYDVDNENNEKFKETTWIVNTHSLNVREKPTKNSKSLGFISMGKEVKGTGMIITGTDGKNWVQVKWSKSSNGFGWCCEGNGTGAVYLKKK